MPLASGKQTGQRKVLIRGGSTGRYVPTGHIVYALGANLLAVPFDLNRLEVTGGPVPIVEGVRRGSFTGLANFNFSSEGTFVYVPGTGVSSEGPQRMLALADRNGKVETLKIPRGSYEFPRISPDGKRLAVRTQDEGGTIWIYDLSGAASLRRLTFEPSNYPLWSPDGLRVAFQGVREGKSTILWQPADGSGVAEPLTTAASSEFQVRPESWFPDGNTVAFSTLKSGDAGISTIEIGGQRKVDPFFDQPGSPQFHSDFSPDGHWLAYRSNESGRPQIYVQPFPKTGAKYQISREAAEAPVWSPDGKEVYYYVLDTRKLVAVPIVQTGTSFSAGEPVTLPIDGILQANEHAQYDVTLDRRLLIVVPAAQGQMQARPIQQIHLVLNWFDELKRLVPTN